MRYDLIQKIRIGFAAGLLLLVVISVLSIVSIAQLNENSRQENHTHQVLNKLEKVISSVKDAETGVRGYILTGKKSFLDPYHASVSSINREFYDLRNDIADNLNQIQNYKILKMQTERRMALLDSILTLQASNDSVRVLQIIAEGHGKILMDRIRAIVEKMKYEENITLKQKQKNTRLSSGVTYTIIIIGNFLALVIVAGSLYFIDRDLSRKKEAEAALKDRQEKLELLNRELEAFTYTISHDLRSPLRAIDGFGKILDEEYSHTFDAEGKRTLGIIRSNALKMGNLIDDLLDFSRLNRKGLNKSVFDMKRQIEDVVTEIRNAYPQWKAEVLIQPIVNTMADQTLMHQVWVNLVSNAFKYSSRKPDARIEIGCINKGREVEYYVSDNGAGFDMEYHDKLFGIFQRLHSHKEFEGTGVGLAIVHRIISRHGGKVTATGVVNEGARFAFTLPLEH